MHRYTHHDHDPHTIQHSHSSDRQFNSSYYCSDSFHDGWCEQDEFRYGCRFKLEPALCRFDQNYTYVNFIIQ